MPRTAAFTGFTRSGGDDGQFNVNGSFSKGWNFYTNGWLNGITVYICALGFRDTSSGRSSGYGDISHYSSIGAYWTAGKPNSDYGYFIYFASNTIRPNYSDFDSCALPLFCTKK